MFRNIVCIIFFSTLTFCFEVYAEESKSDSAAGSIHTTPHPPHDHPSHDHLKKVDEGLRLRKRLGKNVSSS